MSKQDYSHLPQFPEVIDSTMLAAFHDCPHNFYRSYIEHWKPKNESIHLHAGAAFAKGLEVARKAYYEEGKDADTAIQLGLAALMTAYGDKQAPTSGSGSAKSLENMSQAFLYYLEDAFPFATETFIPIEKGIEFSFAEPVDFMHPVTKQPILYCGRLDLVGNFAGGLYLGDDKTASALGASWGKQWELRGQFTGYCWGYGKIMGKYPDGCLIRGIAIKKTGFDHAEHLTTRPKWEIDRWYQQLLKSLELMQYYWFHQSWPLNFASHCASYGGCSMQDVCKCPDPDSMLQVYYEKRIWDPLLREEKVLP